MSYLKLRGTMSSNHCLIDAHIYPTLRSFVDQTCKSALLQLGDIFQCLPEVYLLLFVFGGDQIRSSMQSLHVALNVYDASASTLKLYPKVLMDLLSLLMCHATGLNIVVYYTQDAGNAWHSEAWKFIRQIGPSDVKYFDLTRELFMAYLL